VGYWLLTGKPVFEGLTPMQTVMAHIQKQPVPPSRRTDQKIPQELEEILLSCLRKNPNDRPQTMQELAQRLRKVPLENPWTEDRARRWWLENATEASRRRRQPPEAELLSSPASTEAPLVAGLR
jgi:eukaryotic-like serine/threonine-protein kinase